MDTKKLLFIVFGLILILAIWFMPNSANKSEEQVAVKNLEGKINKAIQLVNEGNSPMEGIMLLREVIAEDTNNVRAHLQLGIFSITSGQFDKAIQRFEFVKKIQPETTDALYYLGHAYASVGERQLAIENFQEFQLRTEDAEMKKEVGKFINELKS